MKFTISFMALSRGKYVIVKDMKDVVVIVKDMIWFHFISEILMNGMTHRIPALEKAEIRQFVNGPESFTPDGKFLFGETPEVGTLTFS